MFSCHQHSFAEDEQQVGDDVDSMGDEDVPGRFGGASWEEERIGVEVEGGDPVKSATQSCSGRRVMPPDRFVERSFCSLGGL